MSTVDDNMILIEEVLNSKNKNIIKDIKPGDRFYTPAKYLELSRSTKIRYSSEGLKEIG